MGIGRNVYGIPKEPIIIPLRREVTAGARAVRAVTQVAPGWYRGAIAECDNQTIEEIAKLGFKITGLSVNTDADAILKKAALEERLTHVKAGDVFIAHTNKPTSDTAKALSVGLPHLLRSGFTRPDQVDLQKIPTE